MIRSTEIPATYTCCITPEGACPLRERCLRSLVHRERMYGEKAARLEVVNLWNEELHPNTGECKQFREVRKKTFARGFAHLFDEVPKKKYPTVKARVVAVFGCERAYYYCKNGTWLTSPDEQARISAIFRNAEVGEVPPYDRMEESYDWE